MKKDELQAICTEQESLLGELKRTLAEQQAALEQALRTSASRDQENAELRSENDRLRTEIEAAAAIYRAEFESLSAGYQSSIETLNKSLSTNFKELEANLRQFLEAELASMAARSKDEDPSEYERMLMSWFMDFMADLESSLKNPPA